MKVTCLVFLGILLLVEIPRTGKSLFFSLMANPISILSIQLGHKMGLVVPMETQTAMVDKTVVMVVTVATMVTTVTMEIMEIMATTVTMATMVTTGVLLMVDHLAEGLGVILVLGHRM